MVTPQRRRSGNLEPPDAYLRLREEVTNGTLPPGSQVLETTTSTRYGVGRAAVREAILALLHDGLLQRGPQGIQVRVRSADEVYEIYQARIVLEAATVEIAAKRVLPLDLSRLQHAHAQAARATEPSEARDWHRRWHTALAQAGRNRTIQELLDRLTLQLAPYETAELAAPDNLETTASEHQCILEAIEAGDSVTAHNQLVSHLERTRDLRVTALMSRE